MNNPKLPEFLLKKPARLDIIDPPASESELTLANEIRNAFTLKGGPGAFMVDIVRAFRLARGAKTYIEVGSRDKGNIAWLSSLLNPKARIIDIDLEHIPEARERLAAYLPRTFDYTPIQGNSIGDKTIAEVRAALGGRQADVIFLDSSHMYSHFLAEISLYWEFLKEDGVLLAHDIFWEGNDTDKGKAQAAERIDRYHPVYVVARNDPVTRFFYKSRHKGNWGGVGIILKQDGPSTG